MLTVGSLFSGIGGMDLGLERAGHKVIWQSEIDPYANRVLQKHWPDVPNIGDVTKLDWSKIPYVEIIAGGYPCQPFSTAGKRRGTNDPRHLWPHVRNAIGRIRPRYALLENVPGHVTLGLDTVLGEISALGYCAEWQIISAAAFGAPHLRERLFIVAYPDNSGGRTPERNLVFGENTVAAWWQRIEGPLDGFGGRGAMVADTNGERPHRTPINATVTEQSALSEFGGRGKTLADTDGRRCEQCEPETKQISWISGGGKRNAKWWETEPDVGRVANGVSNRVDRIRGLGNAVVPQVAEFMGYLISEHAKQFQ